MNFHKIVSGRSFILLTNLSLLGSVCFLLLALTACQSVNNAPVGAAADSVPEVTKEVVVGHDRILEDLGIEVVAIRTTAAGSMLDFRFKVLDKEKSMPFFLQELKPHLIDEKTGAVLEVPVPAKGGPMRPTSRNPRVGITYFMLFGNPGHFVKKGNSITIVVGENRVERLIVE